MSTIAKNPAQTNDVHKVAFVSLGCPKNLVDSEKMLGTLAESGFSLVSDHDEADAIVVNTCGFLEASKQESLDVIGEAVKRKERGDLKRVVVAGCLVQRHRAKLLEWAPGIDAMIGVFDRDHIIDAVAGAAETGSVVGNKEDVPKYWIAGNALQAANDRGMTTVGLTVNGRDGKGLGYFEDDSNRLRLTPRHWAYLRVSEGCNQKCAFCTIPSIRGKMRSKPLDRIVSEARALFADGAFELNLIGQDTTSYGYDIGYDDPDEGLVGMLRELDNAARDYGSAWIRLMYVYPTYFDDAMIDVIAELPNICKYIDIPLQHMSDRMLKTMRRNVTRKQQEDLLYKLRERIPGLAIRTTFITGFPGETEADHAELLEFLNEFQFDMMGVFQYSREDGTPAGRMELDDDLRVPDEVKARREQELMLTQQEIAFENAQYVAEQRSIFDVLIDGPAPQSDAALDDDFEKQHPADDVRTATSNGSESHLYVGRCYHQAPQVDSVTYVASRSRISPGELVRCQIVDSDGYDLIARPESETNPSLRLPVVG